MHQTQARKRYFTVATAEALIPTLEEILRRILQLHVQLRATQRMLEEIGHPATEDLLADDVELSGPEQVRRLQARFRGIYEAIGADVSEINQLGGEVKDLEIGLVDFPALLGADEQVLLCWRMGEKRIGFWHDHRSGFAGRKPIGDVQFASEGTVAH